MSDQQLLSAIQSLLRLGPREVIWPPVPNCGEWVRPWRAAQRHPGGLHLHNYPELCIPLEGDSVLEVGGPPVVFEPPMVAVIPAGVLHAESYGRRGSAYRMLWLMLHDHGVLSAEIGYLGGGLWRSLRRDWLPTLDPSPLSRLIAQGPSEQPDSHIERLRTELLVTLAELHRMRQGHDSSTKPNRLHGARLVAHVRGLIRRRLDRRFTAAELARLVHVSPAYIHRVFSRVTGESLYEYTTHLRMEKAMRLLEGRDAAVKRVASQVGFNDPLYFSRRFHEYFGIAPSQAKHGRKSTSK